MSFDTWCNDWRRNTRKNGGKFKPQSRPVCEESPNLKRRARSKRLTLEENHPCTTSDDTTTLDSRTPLVVLIMSRKSLRDSRSWKSRNLDEHGLLKQAHTRRFCEVNVVVKSARFTALSCFRIKAMVTGGDLGEPRGESRAEKRGRLNGAV